MRFYLLIAMLIIACFYAFETDLKMSIQNVYTIDSIGAGQGVSFKGQSIFMYGDREVGMIREYKLKGDSLIYVDKEIRLTINDSDVINHPTGLAISGDNPVFIGNTIRLNAEGTSWKAVIYCVDWKGLAHSGTLDGNLINTIDDDTCVQGTRPEYVKYKNKWYVATADYGEKSNEVRLYDPIKLKTAKKTSEKGVLFRKFSCGKWVQNLHWVDEMGLVVLVQNQVEGKKWRFSFVDLEKSIESGKQQLVKTIDIDDKDDELEGFTFLGTAHKGIAVTSGRRNNVSIMNVAW